MPKISANRFIVKLSNKLAVFLNPFIQINYTTLYHLIFVVKIKIIMKVCITGSGLSSLALANALAKTGISVDIFLKQKQDKSRTISISKSNVDYFWIMWLILKKLFGKLKI